VLQIHRSLEVQDGVKDSRQITKYSRILMLAHICFHFCISSQILHGRCHLKHFIRRGLTVLEKTDCFFAFLYINMQNNAQRIGSCFNTPVYALTEKYLLLIL
jgi:hypothetical protein